MTRILGFLSGISLNIWLAICAALLAALAIQTVRIEGFLFITGYKQENAVLRIDLDRLKQAQIVAKQKAEAEKLRIEAEYKAKAERTDNAYQAKLASANARIADYARRMRVEAPGGASGGTNTAPENNTAEGADRSGEDAFVAVSRADFDILNENTLRLQAAHEWAVGLD